MLHPYVHSGCQGIYLSGKPQSAHVGSQVLMHLQRCSWWPVAVTAIGPFLQAPAWIHEVDGVRNVGVRVHLPQDGQDLLLGGFVILLFDFVALGLDDGDEEDAGARKEAWTVERLEDGEVATLEGVGVEEELGFGVPEGKRELHEDLGVCAHFEGSDALLLPAWERGREFDGVVLEHTETFEAR